MAPHHQPSTNPGAAIPNHAQTATPPHAEEGSSLVEFALTLPMFMLVVTGVLYFGIFLFNYIMLTQATQISARQLMISRGQTLDPCQLFVNTFYAAAPTLNRSTLNFSFSLNGVLYLSTTSCPGTATSGAPANMVLGTNAIVQVTYPAKIMLVSDSISPSYTLQYQEQERIQ